MDAPVVQRVFWCTLEGLVAIALLLGGGSTPCKALLYQQAFPLPLSFW